MIELVVTTRQALGELWLPWCVERARPDRVLRIDHEPHRIGEAQQLRVAQVSGEETREALRDNGGTDSTAAIEATAATFRSLAESGPLVLAARPPLDPGDWPQAFPLADGPMLHEACHRACALYVAGVERFELRPLVHALFRGWTIYDDAALRRAAP